jgi:cytoskeleton protein RodZ
MEHIPFGDIGGGLRLARELKGLTLADAAERTKLSIWMLEAIERNDFARLPEGMYRKAYVRTLASELDLDPNRVVADYCEQYEPRADVAGHGGTETQRHSFQIQKLLSSTGL